MMGVRVSPPLKLSAYDQGSRMDHCLRWCGLRIRMVIGAHLNCIRVPHQAENGPGDRPAVRANMHSIDTTPVRRQAWCKVRGKKRENLDCQSSNIQHSERPPPLHTQAVNLAQALFDAFTNFHQG